MAGLCRTAGLTSTYRVSGVTQRTTHERQQRERRNPIAATCSGPPRRYHSTLFIQGYNASFAWRQRGKPLNHIASNALPPVFGKI